MRILLLLALCTSCARFGYEADQPQDLALPDIKPLSGDLRLAVDQPRATDARTDRLVVPPVMDGGIADTSTPPQPDMMVPPLPDMNMQDAPLPDLPRVQPDLTQTPPELVCQPPEIVGSNAPASSYTSALSVDGLQLFIQPSLVSRYRTTRPTVHDPFGAWAPVTLFAAWELEDLFFFQHQGQGLVLAAEGKNTGMNRRLVLCTLSPEACTPLTIVEQATGQAITADMDGPSVAQTSSGLILTHNTMLGLGHLQDVYLAQPVVPGDPRGDWISAPVGTLSDPALIEDDPALDPTGLILVYDDYADLLVSSRASLSAPFSPPRPLTELNTSSNEASATLTRSPGLSYHELFFFSDRDGTDRIYRARCDLIP